MATMQELLREAADMGASDLHLSAGEPPLLRVQGDLLRTDHHPLTPENVIGLVNSIIPDAQRAQFHTEHEADFACELWRQGERLFLRTAPVHNQQEIHGDADRLGRIDHLFEGGQSRRCRLRSCRTRSKAAPARGRA